MDTPAELDVRVAGVALGAFAELDPVEEPDHVLLPLQALARVERIREKVEYTSLKKKEV